MSNEALSKFLAAEFPQTRCTIESVGNKEAVVRHAVGPDQLRPGNTVSGPVLMETADVAVYVALLHHVGLVPLAVTTSLTINFLRKPAADRDIIGRCELIKVGRTLVVGDVRLFSEGLSEAVAQASVTYSLPPVEQA